MATIPRSIFKACEWQLHNVKSIRAACQAAAEDAIDSVTPGGGIAQGGKGGAPGDKTGRAALRLMEDDREYIRQCAWLDCLERVREHFEAGPEGEFAKRYYGKKVTMLQVAEAMSYEIQTIYRYRDRYVTYLALVAAGKGLIRIDSGKTQNERRAQ